MEVVIFGAAREGINCYFDLPDSIHVIAFIDNAIEKQGKEILGIRIIAPAALIGLQFDRVYIASRYRFREIENQLLELGVNQKKIEIYKKQESLAEKVITYLDSSSIALAGNRFEKEWQRIKENKKKVNMYVLRVEAIGELISRFLWMYNSFEDEEELNVILPVSWRYKRIGNSTLLELIRKKIFVIEEKDIEFWRYVINQHAEEINMVDVDKYWIRNDVEPFLVQSETLSIEDQDLQERMNRISWMQLDGCYVCFVARTDAYNKRTIGTDLYYDYRNMDFSDYQKAIDYLYENNIQSVRLGREEKPIPNLQNCIDYAGYYADDPTDLILVRNCYFFVGASTGVSYLAGVFNRPLLMVNGTTLSFGYGAHPYTGRDLYIPKKYYDRNRNKFLSLMEIMEIEQECIIDGDNYEKAGIEFVNNTSQEILEAVCEMMQRLHGTWVDTEQDIEDYQRYLEIREIMKKVTKDNPGIWTGAPIPMRLAASYLRNNRYLLDKKDTKS